jgi:hypothetical protein
MKYLSGILIFLLSTTILFGQDRQVYDQLRDDAALGEYQTYAIGDAFAGAENQAWVQHSALLNSMVENAIVYEFDTYEYTLDEENGELVVNFMIFDENYDDKIGYMPGYRVDEDDIGVNNNILSMIGEGSLVISMTDVSEGATVWTGFVTNAVDKDASLREQQKDIRQSVNAAMEMFIAKTNFADSPTTRFDIISEPVDDIEPDDDSGE